MTDTEIILVRHGQANTGATNERDYDRLSPLGHQQANWLGDHFRNIGLTFDHVISGTLRRHKETTDGLMLTNDVEYDARVNEMLYFDMAHEFKRTNGVELPSCATTFAHHVPQVFDAWHAGHFDSVHVPYSDFGDRFSDLLGDAASRLGRTLIVTSGGVIGMSLARHLGLGPDGYARMMLPVRNTSVHQFRVFAGQTYIAGYNATPHLDSADRIHARTTI